MEAAVRDIKTWMDVHFLKLNEDQTEILVIHRPSLCSLSPIISSLTICDCDVTCSSTVRDLGVVVFDTTFDLEHHVTSVCKSAFNHLHSFWKVRRSEEELQHVLWSRLM
jgi:hypothetical protein